MKVLVPVKRVVDYNVKVRVKSDGSGVDLANVKMSMNPFDEIAVEEAIRMKEAGTASEIVVVPAEGAAAPAAALAAEPWYLLIVYLCRRYARRVSLTPPVAAPLSTRSMISHCSSWWRTTAMPLSTTPPKPPLEATSSTLRSKIAERSRRYT